MNGSGGIGKILSSSNLPKGMWTPPLTKLVKGGLRYHKGSLSIAETQFISQQFSNVRRTMRFSAMNGSVVLRHYPVHEAARLSQNGLQTIGSCTRSNSCTSESTSTHDTTITAQQQSMASINKSNDYEES